MSNNKNIQAYIDEIEVWKEASKIHADKAIEQYKQVVANIEEFTFQKQRNEIILDHISDMIIVIDENGEILLFNRMARVRMNLSVKEIENKNIYELLENIFPRLLGYIHLKDVDTQVIEFKEGYYNLNIHSENIANKMYNIIVLTDVTEIIKLQKALLDEKNNLEERILQRTKDLQIEVQKKEEAHRELEKLVLTDFLTKLPNRQAFYEKLKDLMSGERDQEKEYSFAILFIDLDGFKIINDSLGHDIGDKLLVNVAKTFTKCVRSNDFVARLAGDEFVIIVENVQDKPTVERIVKKLISASQQQINIEDEHYVTITVSIGILLNPSTSSGASDILSMADRAMYEVKNSGKNSYSFFNNEMLESLQKEMSIVQKVEEGLEKDEFYLNFQPICNTDGTPVSCEVLSRWIHKGEFISPAEFIPVLENRGMIVKFTYKVIESVFAHLGSLELNSCVSINLSVYQFYEDDLLEYLEQKSQEYKEYVDKISFEITENVFTKDPDMILHKLIAIKKLGYKIYIDDFGTGYSSFEYIRKYPMDVLKIDKIFVDYITSDKKQYQLLQGMIALATSLDIKVIIEGVETKEQLELIKKVDDTVLIQGYYFYKPLDFKTFISL